jgi:hypothetical protein
VPGNVISGNTGNGIEIALPTGSTPGASIGGNFVGPAASGTAALPNGGEGILIDGVPGNTIGGSGQPNVISGNTLNGIHLSGTGATGNVVSTNLIGTTADGMAALGNARNGVVIGSGASRNTVGGATAALANTIHFNTLAGVSVLSGTRNALRRNSIASNGRLGIDLAPAGVNPNVPGGSASGPNLMENYPVIASAVSSGGSTTISGSFNSTPNASNVRLDFYRSTACDASGFGEGATFIGTKVVATNAAGNATFTVTFAAAVPTGSAVTATATDTNGNTSEFSRCHTSS